MSYSLLREAQIVIEESGRLYFFSALAGVSFSTTMAEFKLNRKTVHNKSNYPLSIVTGHNPVTISLIVNRSTNSLESMFFEWLGMERVTENTLVMPFSSKVEPRYINVYLKYPEICYKISPAFVTNADFTLETNVLEFSVGIVAGKCEKMRDIPLSSSIQQGDVEQFSMVNCKLDNKEIPSLRGSGLSFQQQCSWRENKSVYDIGSMHYESKAIIDEMNFSANINAYARDLPVEYVRNLLDINEPIYDSNIQIFNKTLIVEVPSARVTKRLQLGDINTIGFDLVPMYNSISPVSITFLNEDNKI